MSSCARPIADPSERNSRTLVESAVHTIVYRLTGINVCLGSESATLTGNATRSLTVSGDVSFRSLSSERDGANTFQHSWLAASLVNIAHYVQNRVWLTPEAAVQAMETVRKGEIKKYTLRSPPLRVEIAKRSRHQVTAICLSNTSTGSNNDTSYDELHARVQALHIAKNMSQSRTCI